MYFFHPEINHTLKNKRKLKRAQIKHITDNTMILFSVHALSIILGKATKNINTAKNEFPIKPKRTAANQYKLKSLGVLNVFLAILTIAIRGTEDITGTAMRPLIVAEDCEIIARVNNNPPIGKVYNKKRILKR